MAVTSIVRLSAALLAILPALIGATPADTSIVEKPRVAGGQAVSDGDFGFVAYIEGYRNILDSSICTGSLISSKVILTAAHCTFSPMGFSYTAKQLRVSFTHTPTPKTVLLTGLNVTKISVHPDFDPTTLTRDVALLTLAEDVPSSVATQTKIYTGSAGSGTKLVAAGYGLTEPGDEYSAATQLMEVDLVAANSSFCTSRDTTYDSEYYLCTDDSTGRRVCPGDSGGPLAISSDDGYAVVGITDFISISDAFGTPNQTALSLCSETRSASFFSRANAYVDWIAETTKLDTTKFTTSSSSSAVSSADGNDAGSSSDNSSPSADGDIDSDGDVEDGSVDDDDEASPDAKNNDNESDGMETTAVLSTDTSLDTSGSTALISASAGILGILCASFTTLSAFL
ncbi:hypothetical protein H4217_004566 [Coemansia sp. RSA 1939]|nr:hypothetical protein H4217_004566 [Coemansia sp. RSA 1939]KAJ2609565.1 hypothetical protein EV177_004410 [Coemansia sp. RSA 1804]KAJ2693524.1 hypothetical protein GGH99_001112 [Coemansia sp. RSA 1285]